ELLEADRQRRVLDATVEDTADSVDPDPLPLAPTRRLKHTPLTDEDKHEIRLTAALEDIGPVELARRFGRRREAIAGLVQGPEYEKVIEEAENLSTRQAIAALSRLKLPAVKAWEKAIPIAAEKGDHKPARDVLRSTHVIQDDDDRSHEKVIVQVGIQVGE